MIISKTPLRISFAGGGSDFEDYYKTGYGAVISTTIDKHMFVAVSKKFEYPIRLAYSSVEEIHDVGDIRHNLIREIAKLVRVENSFSIHYTSELLSGHEGSGLGASSALAVGLLNALHAFVGRKITTAELAKLACKIEIDILGSPIGKQDQYVTAFGGFNYIKFKSNGRVEVKPIKCSSKTLAKLNARLLMFYTGLESSSQKVLAEQKSKMPLNLKTIDKMVILAEKLKSALEKGSLNNFGNILHENWMYKKSLASKISNPTIDDYYSRARKAGALGGKILGSGGGGFLLFYCPLDKQEKVRRALAGLREINFKFESNGSQIIKI